MMLSKDYWTGQIEDMKSRPYEYHVLKNVFTYREDIERFEYGVHIANLCNTLRIYNKFTKEIQGKEIDYTILSKVFIAVYQDEPFTDEELEQFYKFNTELESLGKAMESFSSNLAEHTYIYSEVEIMMLGFQLSKQERLRRLNDEEWGFISDRFFSLKWEVLKGKRTVKSLKKATLHLLETALQEEEEKAKDKAA